MKEYELTQASCGSDSLSEQTVNSILQAGFNLSIGKKHGSYFDETIVEYEDCHISFRSIEDLQNFIDLVGSVIIYKSRNTIIIYDDYVE